MQFKEYETGLDLRVGNMGSGLDRSTDRLHISEVIHAMLKELNYFGNRGVGMDLNMMAEIGFCWEEALSWAFGKRYADRPGEVEFDDIVGSPDGIKFDEDVGEFVVEEYKATFLSVNKSFEFLNHPKLLHYRMQNMGYCKMLGTLRSRFHVLWVCGDYKPPSPVYKSYDVIYERQELDDNWASIMNYARSREMWNKYGKAGG